MADSASKPTERATELEWLRWFYQNADFGPAHGDVMALYREEFVLKSDKRLPKAYEPERVRARTMNRKR